MNLTHLIDALFAALDTFMDHGTARPAVEELAEFMLESVGTVQRVMRFLRANGVVFYDYAADGPFWFTDDPRTTYVRPAATGW